MSWYRSRYLNIGISGFLSATLVVMILLALMGIRVGEKIPASHIAPRHLSVSPLQAVAFDRFGPRYRRTAADGVATRLLKGSGSLCVGHTLDFCRVQNAKPIAAVVASAAELDE